MTSWPWVRASVQGQQRQSAVVYHAGGHIGVRLGVDLLHPAVHTGGDIGAHGVAGGRPELAVQLRDLGLDIAQRPHHCGDIHRGERRARLHPLAGGHQELIHRDPCGNSELLCVHIRQLAGALYRGDHAAGVHGVGHHRGGRLVADLLPDFFPAEEHRRCDASGQNGHDHHRGNDAADLLFLLVLADGVKERLVPFLVGSGDRFVVLVHKLLLILISQRAGPLHFAYVLMMFFPGGRFIMI